MSKCWYCNEELTTANYCDEHIGICTKCYGSMFKVSNEFVKGLTDKISDLEAKLADKELELQQKNKLILQENGECILCGDCYCINNDVRKIVEENNLLKQQLEESFTEKDVEGLIKDREETIKSLKDQLTELKTENMNIFEYSQKLEKQLTEKEQKLKEYELVIRLDVSLIKQLEEQLSNKEKEIESLKIDLEAKDFNINTLMEQRKRKQKFYNQDKISFAVEQLELLKQKMANFDLPNNPKLYNNDMFCGGFDSHYIKTKEEINNQIEELKNQLTHRHEDKGE